ncbi:MAG TPA: hypothetical protein VHB54_04080 [Mucilaginibacter sp.]|nr:hypothetical protein [Mucilaginibacter sp.]
MKMNLTLKNAAMIFSGLLCFSLTSNAQTLSDVQSSFNNYQQSAIQEKLFVHTDKGAYLTGEIIWFKLYLVDANAHKPLNLSKVAYVEVLDNNQNPVIQAKIELRNGMGSGSVYIPVVLSNGNYKFRAYTNWMKNFSPDYYFEKNITIVNPLKSPDAATKRAANSFDLQFFPEGGELVDGIAGKVAFKATGSDGKGVDFNGAIIDQNKDTVARFRPLKFGMGSFMLTPNANSTYKVVARSAGGVTIMPAMPAVSKQGFAMQLADNGSGQLQISVQTNTAPAYPDVYVFAETGQIIRQVKRGVLSDGKAVVTIDKDALGDGISHLTVFNSSRQPVCERLYFKRPEAGLVIDAAPDQQQYANRKRVGVSLMAKGQGGRELNANLSMSVYKLDDYQTREQGDIASYFWLSSDLRGYIESPEYYLKNTTAEADQAADNLMLTQGWRRFQWKDILKNQAPSFSFLPEYNGHIIAGKIVDPSTNKPAKNVVAYLGVPGKRVQLFTAKSDTFGRLLFNTRDIYGPGEIVVQTNTQHDSTYRIDILNPFSEQYSKNVSPALTIGADMQRALEGHSLGMQVLNVYDNENIKKYYDPAIDSSAFFGTPYKTYNLDDYTRFTTMEEVLREYIRELYVVHPKNEYHIEMISDKGFLDGDPLVMLDGIPIFDMNKVIALDPLKIKRLNVIRDRYFWGPADMEGILSYTSYKGDLGGVEIDPHAVVLDYEGMQLQRVFYSPAYDNDAAAASRVPDFRNTLYWAPVINTNSQGKKDVVFYTSDQKGTYVGVVQGMTADGKAGSSSFTFEVK